MRERGLQPAVYGTRYTPWGKYSLIQAISVCATPRGMVFAPFWSENGYRFCPFWSGIEYGLQRNYGCLPYQFQMNKNESVTATFEKDFRKSFCAESKQ